MTPITAEQFAARLVEWHDFFILAGTAGATLVGLLFVSVSFNIESLLHESRTHLLSLARQSFVAFFIVLVVSLFFLAPGVSARVCGFDLLAIGIVTAIPALVRISRLQRLKDTTTISRRHMLRLSVGPVLAGIAFVFAGYGLMRGDVSNFPLIVAAFTALLFTGAGSAWDLLIRVARARQQERPLP